MFVGTVLRSCLVGLHWHITHIWHSSCFVEIRWRTVIAYVIHTGKKLPQRWGSISIAVVRDGGASEVWHSTYSLGYTSTSSEPWQFLGFN